MNGLLLTLPVALPFTAGLLSYFIRFPSKRAQDLWYGGIICLTTALAWLAILLVGEERVTLLHFTDTLTIALRCDGAARLFAALSATLWPFTALYACDYMRHEKHLAMFWSFFTASFGVTLGIAFSANMLTMYLFYELLTLATLPLVMQPMTAAAKAAGIKYLLYSMSGAALAFIGLVFLILHDAQEFVPGGHLTAASGGDLSMLLPVFVLAFVGFGVKAALWPLHAWLPAAAVAPTPVTALLHAVAVVKAGAFACIRLVYYSCGTELLRGTWAQTVCIVLALVTILYGSVVHSLRRRAHDGRCPRRGFPAPHHALRREDHGLLCRRRGAALRAPRVRRRAGGTRPPHAGDVCMRHRRGLRPDGHPALPGLRQ